MQQTVLILDFGSQYTQLIARRVREHKVYCEIIPFDQFDRYHEDDDVKAVIFSGSPYSVNQPDSLRLDIKHIAGKIPLLGICYGAQLITDEYGGTVSTSDKREYGKASLIKSDRDPLWKAVSDDSQIWMSHADSIEILPSGFELLARTDGISVAAFRAKQDEGKAPIYGLQFHPEVTHSLDGKQIIENFLFDIAGLQQNWDESTFIENSISHIQKTVGDAKVVMGLSGGVDSTVAAKLIHNAIGDNLTCIFVDNGLLRHQEFEQVLESYKEMGFNIKGVRAEQEFYNSLKGLTDPQAKRKAIGKTFIDIFDREANALPGVKYLGQGTIYPDVIESVSVKGPSAEIKSHHNVGGLPEHMTLKLVEPLRMLFKDEVRLIGKALDIAPNLLGRHPFPGPGLGIRILGEISEERVKLCQLADHIYIDHLRRSGWYNKVWQAGAILLPVKSVGVMGDERTYEYTIALRCVNSVDGMTAEWSNLPYELLAEISNDIINKVKGINRVVYDISTKPPATIEWE